MTFSAGCNNSVLVVLSAAPQILVEWQKFGTNLVESFRKLFILLHMVGRKDSRDYSLLQFCRKYFVYLLCLEETLKVCLYTYTALCRN